MEEQAGSNNSLKKKSPNRTSCWTEDETGKLKKEGKQNPWTEGGFFFYDRFVASKFHHHPAMRDEYVMLARKFGAKR